MPGIVASSRARSSERAIGASSRSRGMIRRSISSTSSSSPVIEARQTSGTPRRRSCSIASGLRSRRWETRSPNWVSNPKQTTARNSLSQPARRYIRTCEYMKLALALLASTLASLALSAAPAAAFERTIEVPSDGPGPAQFDHVFVHQMGPARGPAGARPDAGNARRRGRLHPARPRARRPGRRGSQVWSIDRRSQPLEDTSDLRAASTRRGRRSRRCSTTTSAGSPTADAGRRTSTSSTPRTVPVRARVGDGDGARRRPPGRPRRRARAAAR